MLLLYFVYSNMTIINEHNMLDYCNPTVIIICKFFYWITRNQKSSTHWYFCTLCEHQRMESCRPVLTVILCIIYIIICNLYAYIFRKQMHNNIEHVHIMYKNILHIDVDCCLPTSLTKTVFYTEIFNKSYWICGLVYLFLKYQKISTRN